MVNLEEQIKYVKDRIHYYENCIKNGYKHEDNLKRSQEILISLEELKEFKLIGSLNKAFPIHITENKYTLLMITDTIDKYFDKLGILKASRLEIISLFKNHK